jgi:microcystin degradation protein MlrC
VRVGIVALLQESNTFLREPTTLAHFEQDLLAEGPDVRRRLGDAHHEVGGFFAGLDAAKIDAVPVFAARALPFGVVTHATLQALLSRLDAALDRAGPLDGVLVAPHGATVGETVADVDGHWLTRLRDRLGPGVPLIGTLDLHANVSPAMVRACDALIAYRTNPHLDQRQRGLDAAHLMARTLAGAVRPTMAAVLPPLAVNIEAQATDRPPCRPLYDLADQRLQQPGVLSNSVVLGFPYADVPEMGAGVLAVTDNAPDRAASEARELAGAWWDRRAEFVGRLIGIDAALEQAAARQGPVCLLDMGDNVGGGSPGDGTEIAHALHRQRLGPALVCLCDPAAVRAAMAAGMGAELRVRVGGNTDDRHGPPLEADFVVRGIHGGRFEETQPRHGGITQFDQGLSAVVTADSGLTVLLTTKRMVPFSLAQLTSCGLDPTRFRILVAKGVHAPVAAYGPVCRQLIRVNSPGVTTADLGRLNYRNRRRQMFPFETDTDWQPDEVIYGHGCDSGGTS